MTDQFGVLDVAKIIAGDRKVLVASSYAEAVGVVTGFGMARLKEEGTAVIDSDAKMVHWYWPSTADETTTSILVGFAPTAQQIQAVEEAAINAVAPLGEGCAYLLWRAQPEWVHDRNFSDKQPVHQFRMRGSFIWADEPEPTLAEDNLVERVAEAIHQRISDELSKVDKPNWGLWKDADEGSKTIYRSAARAAMESMREPTEKMVENGGNRDGRETAKIVWEDMIEAALGDF